MALDPSRGNPSVVFATLFDELAPGLYRYLARRVGASTAEDLVGETFAAALRDRAQYDPSRGGPSTWLYGIATNLLRRHHRQESAHLRAAGQSAAAADRDVQSGQDRIAEQVDAHRRVEELTSRLAQLNEADRDVLLLTAWDQLSATEVGNILGIPAATVRTRLHRVRTQLKAADTDRAAALPYSLPVIPLKARNSR